MLEPKRIHRRRVHRDKLKGNAQRGHTLAFGAFGLKALEPKFITSRQIEACRVAIARSLQRDGKTFIRIFPDRPMTSKPAETRMVKGKELWIILSQLLNQAVYFSKLPELVRRKRRKHYVVQLINSRLKQSL